MKKLILKYLNRQNPFDNGFIIHDEFFIHYIKEDLKSVFGEDILEEFDIFNGWLYILFPDKTVKVKNSSGYWEKRTYDDNGNQLTFERSDGFWTKRAFDNNGNSLTFERSDGFWTKRAFDNNGNSLTFEDSTGYWYKSTFDKNGKELTFERSDGFWNKRTYDDNSLSYEDSNGIKIND